MIKVAVMGHGVVGSGVVEILNNNPKRGNEEFFVKRILDLRDFDVDYKDRFTKDFNDILNDDEISVVAEVMGGISPAFDFVKSLLKAKKSVVTSNKELVAAKGAELLQIAKENNVNFFFEASVGGGIPVIRPMHHCLLANNITEVAGILNGTTNFILTKMIKEGMDFDTALKIAQDFGYAERNPSADVDGHDACRKICILASLAFGEHVYPQNVYTEGITALTLEDVEYAESINSVIKLIGRTKKSEKGLEVSVFPALIKKGSQLSTIDDVFNGVLVRGDSVGDVVFYGRGAGKLPTASAVVADIIDAAKRDTTDDTLAWVDSEDDNVVDCKEIPFTYYIRLENAEKQAIDKVFDNPSYLTRENAPKNEVAFVTTEMSENELESKLKTLADAKLLQRIRMLNY